MKETIAFVVIINIVLGYFAYINHNDNELAKFDIIHGRKNIPVKMQVWIENNEELWNKSLKMSMADRVALFCEDAKVTDDKGIVIPNTGCGWLLSYTLLFHSPQASTCSFAKQSRGVVVKCVDDEGMPVHPIPNQEE